MLSRFNATQGLKALIVAVAALATAWSASMLVGGFFASGQLDSPLNPLGRSVAYIAAAAIIGATGTFYYVIGFRQRAARGLVVAAFVIVALLTLFASLTQTFMVVDGGLGDSLVKSAESRIEGLAVQARRIDRTMVDVYAAQVAHLRARLDEEARSGRGPRFRLMEARADDLRERYGATLGRALLPADGGQETGLAVVAEAVAGLKGKAAVMGQFAAEAGLRIPDFAGEVAALETALSAVAGDNPADRKAIVYRQVIVKLGDMIHSFGLADLGFTLSLLLSFTPDLIQVLCTILLLLLRARDEPGEEAALILQHDSDWTPQARAWGHQAGAAE